MLAPQAKVMPHIVDPNDGKRKYQFTLAGLTLDGEARTLVMAVDNEDERAHWMASLQTLIDKAVSDLPCNIRREGG